MTLVKQGILVEVKEHTDWVNSYVIVEKDTGNHHSPNHTVKKKLRICLDPRDLGIKRTRDLNEALERELYYTHSTGEITTKFPSRDRMEHARHFPTSMEMCMDYHLTLITEKTQRQHFQDKTSEQSCSTHSPQKKTVHSHAEFPPGMENTPNFLGKQFLQGKEKFVDTGTFTLGTIILINFLNRYSTLSTLTHQATNYKPGRVHQNFQRLKMENSNMEAFPNFNANAETTLQMDTSKKGPRASLTQKVTPMDPEDDIQLPFRRANMITTCNPIRNSTHILMSVQPQDSLSNQLDRLRKSTAQGNQLTRLSHYTNTDFQCDNKNLPTDLHKCWNHRETLSTLHIVSKTNTMNTIMNTICMITIQHLMSEHFSDSISNRSAQPEKNTTHKKYLTRLIDHNHIDQLCDKESSLTDLPESWPHKELLHNIYGLINHGNQIIPMTHKEVYLLSRPLKAMAQWRIHYMLKEVYILSGPSKLQPIIDYTIIT